MNYNTILYWVRHGLLPASIRHESKQWAPVLFSLSDLLELKLIKSLRDRGTSTRRISKALDCLRRALRTNGLVNIYLDVTSDEVCFYKSVRDVLRVARSRGHLLVINVARLRAELEEQARRRRIPLPAGK